MMLEKIDAEVLSLLAEVESLGFSLCLVGGTVRDYLIDQSIGNDLDFEIRPASGNISPNIANEQWASDYQKLIRLFEQKKIAITKHPYLITKISLNGFDLEFSSPRLENQILGNATHHHFNAILDGNLTYDQSFKRRDLTVNAIGVEFDFKAKTEKIVNPYFGVEDIGRRTLRHVGKDFFHDPVRLLRLARFRIKMNGFTVATETMLELSLFNMQSVSVHYLKQEAIKSKNAGRFFNLVAEMATMAKLEFNPKFLAVFQLKYPEELFTIDQIVAYAIMTNKNLGTQIASFFSVPEKTVREIDSFCESLKKLSPVSGCDLDQLLMKDFELIKNNSLIKEYKNIFDKKAWIFLLQYLTPMSMDWHVFLSGELPVMDEHTRSQLHHSDRAFWRYYQKLKQEKLG